MSGKFPIIGNLNQTLVNWAGTLNSWYSQTMRLANLSMSTGETVIYNKESGLWEHGYVHDADGWVKLDEYWSTPSTITGPPLEYTVVAPAGADARFEIGDKIKLTQGGAGKRFVITALASTSIRLNGGSDYALTAAAISDVSVSRAANPVGWPDWFTWTPTLTGFSVNPTGGEYRFRTSGHTCFVHFNQPNTGTSNATTFTATAPITCKNARTKFGCVGWEGVDVGVALIYPCKVSIASSGTVITLTKDVAGTNWTNAGNKRACFDGLIYEF